MNTTEKKIRLLCEYMDRPLGLTTTTPLFTWNIRDNHYTVTSYRIQVKESLLHTKEGGKLMWDSGWTEEKNAHKACYAGQALHSGVTYQWNVTLHVEKCDSIEEWLSEDAFFTTGLMSFDPWTASWIGGIRIDQNSYLYRKQWTNQAKVRHAAAFLASPCYNVLTVNGRPADDTVLNNVFADYEKSLYYRTYDITALVQQDQNAVGIMTGLGWHSLREAEDGIGWGDSLFSLQIRLEYEDGSTEWILSDLDGWKYTTDGPIRYNSIYNGETYDARMEIPGWDCYGFDDSHFSYVVEREAPNGKLTSQILEPIRVVKEVPIQKIYEVADGSYTLDFGKNFAGWVKIRIQGEKGQSISIKPAELLNEDGSVNPVSLRNAHPVDTFILKGEGIEEYQPRFTYHGFRYAQIFGLKARPEPGMFTGCFVRTDSQRIGNFECSDEIVNTFYNIVCQTEESNIHGIPTDCPQRDERLGWLNDMTVRNEGALYNYKHYQLYAKWLRDIRDTQGATTGAVTDTAPFMRYGFRPADPVSASFLLMPWNLYLQYGDDSVIRENYEANARWVDYLKRNSHKGIVRFSSMGDWAAPIGGTDHTSTGGGALSTITPQLLMSTGYLYYDCTLMEKMARVLGKEEDVLYYQNLAREVKEAFTAEYYNKKEKYYASNSQAANIIPLYFGMVPEKDEEAVLDNLCKDIVEAHDGHLTTGNLCTRYAIEVLFQYGREDLAWYLLSQTTYPSWGYMIQNGATTMWERWEKVENNDFLAAMAAMNHPMNGGAVVSLHKYLAGICPDETRPGYDNVILRPVIPSKAEAAGAEIETIRGKVSSKWHREGAEIVWEISIPSGCTASVYLPGQANWRADDQTPIQIGAGEYIYRMV